MFRNFHLSQQNMFDCGVDVFLGSLTRANHVTVLEFHGFGTCCTKLSSYNDLSKHFKRTMSETFMWRRNKTIRE